jgi:hypothetical protein
MSSRLSVDLQVPAQASRVHELQTKPMVTTNTQKKKEKKEKKKKKKKKKRAHNHTHLKLENHSPQPAKDLHISMQW